jgi:hypothetical protein
MISFPVARWLAEVTTEAISMVGPTSAGVELVMSPRW